MTEVGKLDHQGNFVKWSLKDTEYVACTLLIFPFLK
jgi:hypothetical protein